MAIPKIHFPPHEGLPDLSNPALWGLPPTVDGFIEPDVGVASDRAADETGWKRSQRLTYQGAGGVSSAVFQGLKHAGEDSIFLSWLVRFDTYFDDEDVIVLLLRPSYLPVPAGAGHTTDTVRIDIYPVHEGVGARESATSAEGPAEATYNTRPNKPPREITFRRWTGSGWSAPFSITNCQVKCRSWDTGMGQHNKCWSVELKLPTKRDGAKGGGGSWIDLPATASFGIYFNVVRVCGSDLCQDLPVGFPADVYAAFQYTWPRSADLEAAGLGNGIIRSTPTDPGTYLDVHPLDARWLGEASLSSAGARGVSFVAIGTNPTASGSLNYTIDGALATNRLVARIKNDGEAPAPDVTATFRLANWGIGPADPMKWALVGDPPDPPGTVGPNPPLVGTTIAGVPAMGTPTPVDLTLDWTMGPNERARYRPPSDHQCVLVVLNSATGANFVEGSRHTNLNFVNLSEHESEVEISGVGHRAPDAHGDHHILLRASPRLLQSSTYLSAAGQGDDAYDEEQEEYGAWLKRVLFRLLSTEEPTGLERQIFGRWKDSGAFGKEPVGTLLWIVNAYRATADVVTIGRKTFRLYDPVSTFTYAAQHVGEAAEWRATLTGGDRLSVVNDDTYVVRVPDGGSVRLGVVLRAVPPEEYGILDRVLDLIDRIQALLGRLRGCADRLDAIRALLRRLARLARAAPVLKELAARVAEMIERCDVLHGKMSVLSRIGDVLSAMEQQVEELDRTLDKLRSIDRKKLEEVARKLYGAEADAVLKRLDGFVKAIQSLGETLMRILLRLLDRLEGLAAVCHRLDDVFSTLRALVRQLDKGRILRRLGDTLLANVEKITGGSASGAGRTFPPRGGGNLGAYVAALAEAIALHDELAGSLEDLRKALRALEKLGDDDLVEIVDRIHDAAT